MSDASEGPDPRGRRSIDSASLIRLGLRTLTALFFIFGGVLLLARHAETWSWPSSLGTIERLAAVPATAEGDLDVPGERFEIDARYRYTVDGKAYQGTRVSLFRWIYPSRQRVAAYLERHQLRVNDRAPVYYDPDDPGTALLVRAVPWRRVEVILAVVLLWVLPTAVIGYSVVDVLRGGSSRREDRSRGRFW